MESSSKSRSRSNRRSPDRRASPPKGKGTEEEEEPKAAAPECAEVSRAERRASQSKVRTSGAVQNRRKQGDRGTWTCHECRRTIADNDCSKKQHWYSLHCRASRLYNRGCHDGNWEACKRQIEREMKAEAWDDEESNVRLRSKQRSRGAEPPPEPKNPPRASVAKEHPRTRASRTARTSRSRQRRRASDREAPASRRRSHRSRSRHRRGRDVSRRRSHSRVKDVSAPDKDFVEVTVKKYVPRHRATATGMEAVTRTVPPKEAQESSSTGKVAQLKLEKPKEEADDSDYTYEYESSTPEATAVEKEVAKEEPGAKPSGKKVPLVAVPGNNAALSAPAAPKAGVATGRPAASDAEPAAGVEFRNMMTDLLKTAMETAGKRFQ